MIDAAILEKHCNIALQFSGGKDSLAVAELLKPHWHRLTFYHVDAGDALPEVAAAVDAMAAAVPRFVRIATDADAWMRRVGPPTDLVPYTGLEAAVVMGHGHRVMVDRYTCCYHNVVAPMHNRMIADGVTLVIRGSKRADGLRMPAESGHSDGYDLWLPLQEWSHADVFAFLKERGVAVPAVYDGGRVTAPTCATCPAYWDEGRAAFLKARHPELFDRYAGKLRAVAGEVVPVWRALMAELNAVGA